MTRRTDGSGGQVGSTEGSEGPGSGAASVDGSAPRPFFSILRVRMHRAMRAMLGRIVGPMLTCRELIDFLWRYEEHDLSPAERRAFDRHLAVCPSCRAYLGSYRKTIALGRAAYADPGADVPAEVPDEIVAGILAARRARNSGG